MAHWDSAQGQAKMFIDKMCFIPSMVISIFLFWN